jgi:hypothetical protein
VPLHAVIIIHMSSSQSTVVPPDELGELRKRVESLEATVARLSATIPVPEGFSPSSIRQRLAKLAGSFSDDPGFEEMTRLGQEWRQAERDRAVSEDQALGGRDA